MKSKLVVVASKFLWSLKFGLLTTKITCIWKDWKNVCLHVDFFFNTKKPIVNNFPSNFCAIFYAKINYIFLLKCCWILYLSKAIISFSFLCVPETLAGQLAVVLVISYFNINVCILYAIFILKMQHVSFVMHFFR